MSLISAELREAVVERAANRCEYCQLSQDSQVVTFPIDHVRIRALLRTLGLHPPNETSTGGS